MVDIAQQLQMTGPALYHYFGTKDELLFACIEQLLDGLHTELRPQAGDDAPRDRMARVVRAQVTMELKNGSAAPLVNAHLYGPQYLTDMLQPAHGSRCAAPACAGAGLPHLIDQGAAGDFRVDSSAVAAFNVLAVVQYSGVWYRPAQGAPHGRPDRRPGRRGAATAGRQRRPDSIQPDPKGLTMSFGILIYPGVEELDFQGPWEMVGMWHKYNQGPKPLLLARSLDPVTCAHGMRVLPDTDLAAAPAR
jgi:AcrR family transcriptional regulator